MGDRAAEVCWEQTGPVWKIDGEICGCVLPEGHEHDHRCSCGSFWNYPRRTKEQPA